MTESIADIVKEYKHKGLDTICRICMKTGDLQSIYEFRDKFKLKSQDLSKKLKVCCDVDIYVEDKMPSNICEVCSDALFISYDLRVLCKNTDSILREILSINIHKQKEKRGKKSKSYRDYNKKAKRKQNKRYSKDIFIDADAIKLEEDYSRDEIDFLSENLSEIIEDDNRNYDSDDQVLSQLIRGCSQNNSENDIKYVDNDLAVEQAHDTEEGEGTTMVEVPVERKKYKCYACNMTLPTRWDRQLHEDIDCPEMPPGTPYRCRLCPVTAPDRDKFDKHIWIDHRGTLPPESERSDIISAPKIRTRLSERDQPLREIICEKCGVVLKNMRVYLQHCLRHDGKHWLQCKQCSFRTTNRHSFNIHNKYRHLGYDLIRCDQCSFKTDRKENLKVHQRRHTGERPYTCSLCDYRAVNQSNLKKHLTTHTNVRAYECNVCGLSYTTNRALKCHKMRIHEHVRMFYCKPCHTKYIGEDAFKRHLMKKHSLDNNE